MDFSNLTTLDLLRSHGGISDDPFDRLAAVLFASDFTVHRAALILIAVVRSRVRRSARTNSDVFHPRDDVWNEPGVVDLTDQLRDFAEML